MNTKEEKSPDELISLKIMDEISEDSNLTQRALSERLGIALGLVNTYLKHLIKKGYIRVTQFPRSRYKYLITPEGLSEKSRLVYKHLNYYNNFFKTIRNDTLALFKKMEKEGIKSVIFCGIDEVAEIAYLSLKETNINFLGFFDINLKGKCLGFPVDDISKVKNTKADAIFLSSVKKKEELYNKLISLGIEEKKIFYLNGDSPH
ncbi:MAG: winged helix-turn-helix transcriptional regulator [bacterium]